LKIDPGFVLLNDKSGIVDLRLVEPLEKFLRNLDPFQFLTGGEGVRNPLKV
jgi:hypothetical protein